MATVNKPGGPDFDKYVSSYTAGEQSGKEDAFRFCLRRIRDLRSLDWQSGNEDIESVVREITNEMRRLGIEVQNV